MRRLTPDKFDTRLEDEVNQVQIKIARIHRSIEQYPDYLGDGHKKLIVNHLRHLVDQLNDHMEMAIKEARGETAFSFSKKEKSSE